MLCSQHPAVCTARRHHARARPPGRGCSSGCSSPPCTSVRGSTDALVRTVLNGGALSAGGLMIRRSWVRSPAAPPFAELPRHAQGGAGAGLGRGGQSAHCEQIGNSTPRTGPAARAVFNRGRSGRGHQPPVDKVGENVTLAPTRTGGLSAGLPGACRRGARGRSPLRSPLWTAGIGVNLVCSRAGRHLSGWAQELSPATLMGPL